MYELLRIKLRKISGSLVKQHQSANLSYLVCNKSLIPFNEVPQQFKELNGVPFAVNYLFNVEFTLFPSRRIALNITYVLI